MTTPGFELLSRREHRARLIRSIARVVTVTVVLVGGYALIPAAGRSGAWVAIRLAIGALAFSAVVAWQLRSVTRADHPRLRAAEALAIAVVLLVVGFAYTYLSISHGDPHAFSERLDHVGAIYFALTTITTVGFGDIVARTDSSRLVVMAQFVFDVTLIFGLVRVYFGTALAAGRAPGLPPGN
jgi:voltage-gated potassium channel